jgi:CDGSH-type Zn-finger protein
VTSDQSSPVRITVVEDGPLRVRGHVEVLDSRNRLVLESNGLVLLCRCGNSANKPFCDGSHLRVGFRDASPCPPSVASYDLEATEAAS